MNYVVIAFLIMVIFLLLPNRRIYERAKIEKLYGKNITEEVKNIQSNIIYINKQEIQNLSLVEQKISNSHSKYVVLCDKASLKGKVLDIIISNFILSGMKTSGFNYKFVYGLKKINLKNIIRKIFVVCINYIVILARNNYTAFDIIISKADCFVDDIKNKRIIKFGANPELSQDISNDFHSFKKCYMDKYSKAKYKIDIDGTLSVLLVTLAGSLITANIFVIILNPIDNIWDIIVCAISYICYSNIISQLYNPIGKFRLIASYIFPVYIVVYFLYTSYYFIRKEWKKK